MNVNRNNFHKTRLNEINCLVCEEFELCFIKCIYLNSFKKKFYYKTRMSGIILMANWIERDFFHKSR